MQPRDRESGPVGAKVLAPGWSTFANGQMSWGDVAFDADLVANVLGDLAGAPALYAGDVELGKSASGHQVMIAAEKPHRLDRRTQHRFRLGNAERLGRSGPAKYSTWAVVEFRSDGVELVLSERGQIGVSVQVLAQQSVRVLVGAALPWVVRVAEEHRQCQRRSDGRMLRHLTPAVPGQRPPQVGRQLAQVVDQCARHRVGLVPVGQCDDQCVAGGAVNEGGDGRWARSEHEVALPMAGHLPGVGLGRSFADGDYVADLAATVRTLLSARPSDRTLAPQTVKHGGVKYF